MSIEPLWLDTSHDDFPTDFAAYLRDSRGPIFDVSTAVGAIIAAVRTEGDVALHRFCQNFDNFDASEEGFRVEAIEIDRALDGLSAELRANLELAAQRIRDFHEKQLPKPHLYEDEAGLTLGWRWSPIEAIGLYVPGGLASYPSSVLMNALPAAVAGVKRRVMVTPARGGRVNSVVLAAAKISGIEEIYAIGGAQAIAALAYGSESVRPVDKIVGPGNAYVSEAKRQVFGQVGIDTLAGPSEILIIADKSAKPAWLAADLLSQAEHDPTARAILITPDEKLARDVASQVERLLAKLPDSEIAAQSWQEQGAIILVASLEEAAALSNQVAPEHLELALAEPEALLDKITHAGAIFLGHLTPVALGDYIAGPNHVLPTAGAARFSSGLSVLDFLTRSSIIGASPAGLQAVGGAAEGLARAEGLEAHAHSLALRLKKAKPDTGKGGA